MEKFKEEYSIIAVYSSPKLTYCCICFIYVCLCVYWVCVYMCICWNILEIRHIKHDMNLLNIQQAFSNDKGILNYNTIIIPKKINRNSLISSNRPILLKFLNYLPNVIHKSFFVCFAFLVVESGTYQSTNAAFGCHVS